ncbi:MAG: phosphopantetheine-binding protein [Gemmatimonas sp.]
MPSLETDVKQLIIDSLQLEELTPADIDTDAPLFVEGLGLDSIDALELGMAIRKKYDVQLAGDPDESRKDFASVRTLMALIERQPK